jgi:hypothetical protein
MTDQHDQPLDLSALDPTAEGARFDGIVRSILGDAAAQMEGRRARNNVIGEITRWYKPILAAAAAAVAVLTFSLAQRSTSVIVEQSTSGVAEAIGIPDHFATWIRGESTPSAVELYSLFAGQ